VERNEKNKFKMPHTFVILFFLICILTLLTHIIPAGNFERTVDEATGLVMMDADSFKTANEQSPVGLLGMFFAIQSGFVSSASIIFLVFFAYFCVYTITKTGSFHSAINLLLKKLSGKEALVIPIFFTIFALAGSVYGEWDTIFGLIPIFVRFSIAIGYDAMVGLAISGMTVAFGFASATTNPFTIGIAQSYGDLPLFSGLGLRCIVFVVFVLFGILWTMRYAKAIKADPSKSIVKGIDFKGFEFEIKEDMKFTGKQKLTMILLLLTIAGIVYGTLNFDWYIDEMAGIFLFSGVVISIIWKMHPNEIVQNLLDCSSEILVGAFVVGISRTVLVILQEGNIIDTIIYYMYLPFKGLSSLILAEGMLIFQNIMNFFIPSGSGQASAVMPIMMPLADLGGLNRQIATLAYQFGDGYSNLLWPTGGIAIMCTIAKIPLDKWYKFFLPLFGIMFAMEAIFIAIAVFINYGPF